ncbi:MAG: hypothetical protein NZ870_01305 [bacterium]|nr:hypothetical protein [bacterium]
MPENKFILISYANKLADAIMEMINKNLIPEKELKKINERFLNYLQITFIKTDLTDEKKDKMFFINELYDIITKGKKMDFGVVKLSIKDVEEILELKDKLVAAEKEFR